MIYGIGTDIVDYNQLRTAIERSGQRLIDRIFTPAEQTKCKARVDPIPCFSSRFAAKEAVSKALRLGIFKAGLTNIEVLNRPDGSPYIAIGEDLAAKIPQFEHMRFHLSLTDGQAQAIAFAVIEITLPGQPAG